MLKIILLCWAFVLNIVSIVVILSTAGLSLVGAEITYPPIHALLGGLGLPMVFFFVVSLVFGVWFDKGG